MPSVLWKLPVPSTALLGSGPIFEKRPGRIVALRFSYEGDDGDVAGALVFDGVEAFKCTYLSATESGMLDAYDQLIDRGNTPWLASVETVLSGRGPTGDDVRHMMIFFDDGPCYEVLCRTFRVEST